VEQKINPKTYLPFSQQLLEISRKILPTYLVIPYTHNSLISTQLSHSIYKSYQHTVLLPIDFSTQKCSSSHTA